MLRCGINVVRLDRKTQQVLQEGRSVERWNEIEGVHLLKSNDRERNDGWRLLLQLKGCSPVVLGEVTDEVDASITAAKIARFCNVPVMATR